MSHDRKCHVAQCKCDLVAACQCDLIAEVRADERSKHHRLEVMGGWIPTCCMHCKTHVQPHVRCALRDDYEGPLPEGHTWDE